MMFSRAGRKNALTLDAYIGRTTHYMGYYCNMFKWKKTKDDSDS